MASQWCRVCDAQVASGVGNPRAARVTLGCPVPTTPRHTWYHCEQCGDDASFCAEHAGDHEHAVVLGPRHSALVTCPLCARNGDGDNDA
jgi:hypothetical protein